MSYNAIYFNNGFMRNGYIFSPIFGDLQKLKCVGDETTIILFGIECLISWMKDCIIFSHYRFTAQYLHSSKVYRSEDKTALFVLQHYQKYKAFYLMLVHSLTL